MSILDKTTNLELTQYGGSPVKAQLYANYNSDMQKIDAGYAELKGEIDGTNGLGERVSALETSVTTIDEKADGAVSTANDAKNTADGMDTRVTAVEGDVSDLKTWKNDTVDPTLSAYDSRLDAIELVIDTVSTANINYLIARMDALEQKVDSNTQAIDTLNDNLISAVDRIEDLERELGTTNANLNALTSRVTLLEDCCSSVRETLTNHNTRINKNASDISALDARLTRDETNIAGNASDITILATQNNTQAGQIDDLYSKYNALDPTSPTNLYSRVQTLEDTMGNSPLQTVAQTVTGAINELFGHATDVQGAIDEVNGKVDVDSARIGALETTVGDNNAGLVKDVNDLQTEVAGLALPSGMITPYGGATAPNGWLLCDGTAVSRETYADLFAVIGTAFGSGDGSTTFNVPDMRECTAKGAGLYGGTVGAHVDADGIAVGEFLDDRVESHTHTYTERYNAMGYVQGGTVEMYNDGNATTLATSTNGGRYGDTTEVKSIGVNYIVKI